MAQYIIEEKILITKEYIHTRTYMETQNTFRIQFPAWSVSSKFSIHYCYRWMYPKTHTKVQLLVFWRVWVISLILFCLLVLWPKTGSSCTMSLFMVSWLKIYSPWNFIIFWICTPKFTITITAVNSYLLMLELWYFMC